MFCTNDHYTILAKLAIELKATNETNPLTIARDLRAWNVAAYSAEHQGEWAKIPDFQFNHELSLDCFLPVQKIEAILTLSEQCKTSPLWESSESKAMLDRMLTAEIKQLEGYGATWHLIAPSTRVTTTDILPNKMERGRDIT